MTSKSIAKQIMECFKRGNKVIVFGNGGSLSDAGHFAAEFHGIGPVIALNDPTKITSIANDYGYEYVFGRQILDLGVEGDLIIGISSSGKSDSINNALYAVAQKGMLTIDLPRKGRTTAQVQNYQYRLLHEIYEHVRRGEGV